MDELSSALTIMNLHQVRCVVCIVISSTFTILCICVFAELAYMKNMVDGYLNGDRAYSPLQSK